MNMAVAPSTELDNRQLRASPDLVWYHPAFCQLALPLAPVVGSWRRELDGAVLAIEPAATEQPTASGWCLRLLLMHICDRAVQAASPVVELGADASALATELNLPQTETVLREITEQLERLASAKLTVGLDGAAPLGVLDARGQSRRATTEWRPRLRLNARFHAVLTEKAVALDRRIVTALAAEPMALDAHGWIRLLLNQQVGDATTTVPWLDLTRRFGSADQPPAEFRAAFEDALRMVFAADFSISLAADDEGVTVGTAAPPAEAAPEPAAVAPPAPAAAPSMPPAAPPAVVQPELPYRPVAVPAQEAVAPYPRPSRRPPAEAAQPAPRPEAAPRDSSDTVRLGSHLTGLSVVVWLRRGEPHEQVVIGATPGTRMDAERLTLLMLEPLIMQVSGGLNQGEFDKVSAWAMANRDLIDQVWEGEAGSFEEIVARVKRVPAPGWR